MAWLEDGSDSTCIKGTGKTEAMFGFAELAWEKIPAACKVRQKTMAQLDEWIAAFAPDHTKNGGSTRGLAQS